MRETTTIIKPLPNDHRSVNVRIKQHMDDINNLGDREAAKKRKEEGSLVSYQEEVKVEASI